jgi:hypothetical protein
MLNLKSDFKLTIYDHFNEKVAWPLGHVSYCHHFLSVVRPSTLDNLFHPPFFLFLVGGHLGWKSDTILEGAIQGPFHQSLVAIGPVVSEEMIKM